MKKTTEEQIGKLQRRADEQRLCIVPATDPERQMLSRQKRAGSVVSPWRGMFALASTWNQLKPSEQVRRIVRTLARRYPTWVFCGTTAAVMHGLEVSRCDLMPIHVIEDPLGRIRSTQSVVREPMTVAERTVVADDVAVTSLEHTVMDCLIELGFQRGLAIADSALRVSGLPSEHFIDYVRRHIGVPGWERALDALVWADPRAANGGESVARAVMIEQGFMLPDLQVEIPNVIEGGQYYADFFWRFADGSGVVGELDGLDKYCDPEMTEGRSTARVMSDERRRESRIGAAGYRVMRFSFSEVMDTDMFVQLLGTYGIPRGKMRPRGRRDR